MESHLKELLKSVLNLEPKDEVILTSTGIKVKSSRWGICELGALGDGYRATTTWIMDLTSWWVLYLRKKSFYRHRNIEGIVLVDEVEQHLHPRWQLKILNLLSDSFPRVQFIATTHSPLVISGSRSIPVLQLRGGSLAPINVYGWRAEDVYRDVMGLASSRPDLIVKDIREFRRLDLISLSRKLSITEHRERQRLKRKLLKTLHGSDPLIRTLELENLKDHLKIPKKVDECGT